jgi:putative ABC transport system substrate-binding protein
MRRREFIAGLGSAAAWPLAASAQQPERVRRIAVLMYSVEDDPQGKILLSSFTQGLTELGWIDGRNLRMDVRWAGGNVDAARSFAKELVDLQPDVILANETPQTGALQRATRTIPIVFAAVFDPVGDGFVASLPRPGGNITGFSNLEASMAGKWLELLTETAPGVKRAAILYNPDTAARGGAYFLPVFEAAARSPNEGRCLRAGDFVSRILGPYRRREHAAKNTLRLFRRLARIHALYVCRIAFCSASLARREKSSAMAS